MTPATIEYLMIASCLSKENLSEEKANNIIDNQLAVNNLVLYYYKCPLCNSIHLTRSVPNNEQVLKVI